MIRDMVNSYFHETLPESWDWSLQNEEVALFIPLGKEIVRVDCPSIAAVFEMVKVFSSTKEECA